MRMTMTSGSWKDPTSPTVTRRIESVEGGWVLSQEDDDSGEFVMAGLVETEAEARRWLSFDCNEHPCEKHGCCHCACVCGFDVDDCADCADDD